MTKVQLAWTLLSVLFVSTGMYYEMRYPRIVARRSTGALIALGLGLLLIANEPSIAESSLAHWPFQLASYAFLVFAWAGLTSTIHREVTHRRANGEAGAAT